MIFKIRHVVLLRFAERVNCLDKFFQVFLSKFPVSFSEFMRWKDDSELAV